jgi:hypothetical protein
VQVTHLAGCSAHQQILCRQATRGSPTTWPLPGTRSEPCGPCSFFPSMVW